tara:strand:- start:217 stop:609 length:393 start_codon:yes stop_codon:yes gene_type:complete
MRKPDRRPYNQGGPRQLRIADQLQKTVATSIDRVLTELETSIVTVTNVKLTCDYKHATIFITDLNGEDDHQTVIEHLQSKIPVMRRIIAKKMHLRRVPQIDFAYDESIQRGSRLSNLIDELVVEDKNLNK